MHLSRRFHHAARANLCRLEAHPVDLYSVLAGPGSADVLAGVDSEAGGRDVRSGCEDGDGA